MLRYQSLGLPYYYIIHIKEKERVGLRPKLSAGHIPAVAGSTSFEGLSSYRLPLSPSTLNSSSSSSAGQISISFTLSVAILYGISITSVLRCGCYVMAKGSKTFSSIRAAIFPLWSSPKKSYPSSRPCLKL